MSTLTKKIKSIWASEINTKDKEPTTKYIKKSLKSKGIEKKIPSIRKKRSYKRKKELLKKYDYDIMADYEIIDEEKDFIEVVGGVKLQKHPSLNTSKDWVVWDIEVLEGYDKLEYGIKLCIQTIDEARKFKVRRVKFPKKEKDITYALKKANDPSIVKKAEQEIIPEMEKKEIEDIQLAKLLKKVYDNLYKGERYNLDAFPITENSFQISYSGKFNKIDQKN